MSLSRIHYSLWPLMLFALPISVMGVILPTPIGSVEVTNPITIEWNTADYIITNCLGHNYWGAEFAAGAGYNMDLVESDFPFVGDGFYSKDFHLPIGAIIQGVQLVCSDVPVSLIDETTLHTQILSIFPSISSGDRLFTIISSSGITIATSTAASLLSVVSAQFTDTGTLAIIALAAGIPFAFYVIRRLIGLVPKGK